MFKKILMTSFLLLTLSGCSANNNKASIVTANEVREIAVAEHKIISNYCILKYQMSETMAEIEKVDKICIPAKLSYYAVKISWNTLVGLLKKSQVTTEEIQAATDDLSYALETLQTTLETMK